jgi:hypothetical protein
MTALEVSGFTGQAFTSDAAVRADAGHRHVPEGGSFDVPDLQVLFVGKPDPVSTALGARGFGETPTTGSRRRSATRSTTPPAAASEICRSLRKLL